MGHILSNLAYQKKKKYIYVSEFFEFIIKSDFGMLVDKLCAFKSSLQEHKPSYSVPLDDSISIKDLHWARKVAKGYLILSSDGKLYYGSGQGPVTYVMEDVDSGMLYLFMLCCLT